jgi:hypothetical protein
MIEFVCDYCGNVKEGDETWITGIAVENVGTKAARREVLIDSLWRYERAVLPLAVHFCCLDCKDSYMDELFSKPVSVLEVQSVVEPEANPRVIRAKKVPVVSDTSKRTRKTKRVRAR